MGKVGRGCAIREDDKGRGCAILCVWQRRIVKATLLVVGRRASGWCHTWMKMNYIIEAVSAPRSFCEYSNNKTLQTHHRQNSMLPRLYTCRTLPSVSHGKMLLSS